MASVRLPIRDEMARKAAQAARERLRIGWREYRQTKPIIGFVLGTGWGDRFRLDNEVSVPLKELPGFEELEDHPSHARRLCYGTRRFGMNKDGTWRRVPMLVLRGRVHMNEVSPLPDGPARPDHFIRLYMDMMIFLGARKFVLTCAAGSLNDDEIKPGDVLVIDDLLTKNVQQWPAYAGEFKQPTEAFYGWDVLGMQGGLRLIRPEQQRYRGRYAFQKGPIFETFVDKEALAAEGGHCVGMSLTMETAVAALHDEQPRVRVIALAAISNGAVEKHSDAENRRRMRAQARTLEEVLDYAHYTFNN